MSTIIEATVSADQFALAETFTRAPDVEFRVVRLVDHGVEHVMPFLWAECDDTDRLRNVLERDQSVRSVDVLGEFDGECLLWIDWNSRVRTFATILGEHDASIFDASGYDGSWHFQIFFPDHDLVRATFEGCEENGIDASIDRINRLSETSEHGFLGLTERQYETVASALEYGYYDVPRTVNQEELASHFGVSHQALSERLRRAHQAIITNALDHRVSRRNHAVSP